MIDYAANWIKNVFVLLSFSHSQVNYSYFIQYSTLCWPSFLPFAWRDCCGPSTRKRPNGNWANHGSVIVLALAIGQCRRIWHEDRWFGSMRRIKRKWRRMSTWSTNFWSVSKRRGSRWYLIYTMTITSLQLMRKQWRNPETIRWNVILISRPDPTQIPCVASIWIHWGIARHQMLTVTAHRNHAYSSNSIE